MGAPLPQADGSFCSNQCAKDWLTQTLMSSMQTFSLSLAAAEPQINPLSQVKQQPSKGEGTRVITDDKWKARGREVIHPNLLHPWPTGMFGPEIPHPFFNIISLSQTTLFIWHLRRF